MARGDFDGDARRLSTSPDGGARARADLNAAPPPSTITHAVAKLDVYQLAVPYGAISRNDEFWKRLDEGALDVATYDVLLKNGFRVGMGDVKDWAFFKARIDDNHAAIVQGSSNPTMDGRLEVPLRPKVDYQNLFWFDSTDTLWGRTFDQSENLLAVGFRPHDRKEEHTSIVFCPMVRGLRKHLEYSVRNDEREFEMVYPESLLDLSARVDVPPERFLVIAPAEVANLSTSAGKAFLTEDQPTQRLEKILILVPHCYRLSEVGH